jgi:GDP-D-mannose dehydratase
VLKATQRQEAVYNLAAQTAVTLSVANPRSDFQINALGTFCGTSRIGVREGSERLVAWVRGDRELFS